jgi:hypothetical protein
VTFVSRFARGRRLDRNPLRRASDRAETVVLTLLVVAFLVGAPLAALASGARVHAIAERTALAQQASRHQVMATVEEAPLMPPDAGNVATAAELRWTAANGKAETGWTSVPLGTQVGAKVRVWATQGGQLTSQPLLGSQVKDLTILGGTAGAGAVAALLALCGITVRWSLNRRRMAAWDVDWRTTGPRWTTRR